MIEIKDLSYTIGKKEILKNISFTVNKGSMTCIVGPNGCGKSTLLAHISRRFPSRNSIYYKGRERNTQKKWLSWYSRDLGWQAI